MRKPDFTAIQNVLTRGVAEVIDRRHLEARMGGSRRLRVKLGIDPTGSRLHLGHAVVLRILRRFQDLGHTAVLIIGDTTAAIGDPSGRNETRPPLTRTEIARNFATYERQALKILDRKRIEFRWQSEWYKKFSLTDLIQEASKLSAGWILSHETFRSRVKAGQPLGLHELLYPLIQAYDSMAVRADVELGGLDQKFNILTGRELMKTHGRDPQDVVLAKYLVGTDGQKMGKTLGNFIALDEEAFEMFGKVMRMPDGVLRDYFELATDVWLEDFDKLRWEGAEARNTKMFLARKIVEQYHGIPASQAALRRWEEFVQGEGGQTITVRAERLRGPDLRAILIEAGIGSSKSEVQRLFEQGAVTIDGRIEKNWKQTWSSLGVGEHRLQVGKKKTNLLFRI